MLLLLIWSWSRVLLEQINLSDSRTSLKLQLFIFRDSM
jgi:hypothetical protein